MKKYFVGFLAGVLLTFSMSVYADDIKSLIGQKVQGTVSVNVNGTTVADGVIIKGYSYAPVRSLTEAAGLEVNYEKGVVTVVNTQYMTNTTGKEITFNLEQINKQLENLYKIKEQDSARINNYELILQDKKFESQWPTYQKSLEAVKAGLQKYLDRIDELEVMKAALQPTP